MADSPGDLGALDPDAIGRRDFTTTFRGYDQVEVKAFLNRIGSEVRSLRARETELIRRVEEAERRAGEAEEPDESRLTALLGEETARILDAAREAANEIRAKAEAKTAQLVREAQDEASRMTTEAAEVLRLRTAEAEEAAAAVRSSSEAERDRLLADANTEAERLVGEATAQAEQVTADATTAAELMVEESTAARDQAVGEAAEAVESGRQQGREMVAEAQVVRERILTDLARRRKAARAQLEQLRAARERLIDAYAVVRRTLDEATTELTVAVPEARLAAESAGRRMDDEDELSVEEIEAELDAGRFAGLPILDPADGDDDPGDDVGDAEDDDEDGEAGVDSLFARIRAEVPDDDADEDDDDTDADEDAGDQDDQGESDEDEDEDEAEETVLDQRDRHTVALERDLSRALKRQLADDENDKLDLIRRRTAKDPVDVVLGKVAAHRAAYVAAVADVLESAAAAGVEFASELLDDGAADAAVDTAALAAELADALVVPVRDKVGGLLEGSEGDDALDEVRACYRQWKGRAGDLAGQFVHTAFNLGVYAAVPDGDQVSWVLDDSVGPCPDGEDDALGGPITKGEEFPTGHLHPPAHPACRCLLVPGVL